MAKETNQVSVSNTLSIRQRFEKTGLSLDAIPCTINAVSKSTNDKVGSVYTFTLQVINKDNKIEMFVAKIFAGLNNADHIKSTEESMNAFKPGDYVVRNAQLRVQGETWDDGDGHKGVYSENYIAVPFVSDLLAIGENAIIRNKETEIKLAKLALSSIVLEAE